LSYGAINLCERYYTAKKISVNKLLGVFAWGEISPEFQRAESRKIFSACPAVDIAAWQRFCFSLVLQ
jgi:hypothetical protein